MLVARSSDATWKKKKELLLHSVVRFGRDKNTLRLAKEQLMLERCSICSNIGRVAGGCSRVTRTLEKTLSLSLSLSLARISCYTNDRTLNKRRINFRTDQFAVSGIRNLFRGINARTRIINDHRLVRKSLIPRIPLATMV